MKELNTFQKYFVEEFFDDYREGLMPRREFLRRLLYITGGMAASVATLSLLGCTPGELAELTATVNTVANTATALPDTAVPTIAATVVPTDETSPGPTESAPAADSTEPPVAQLEPVPGAQSPYSVPEGDPAVVTGNVSFSSEGDQIVAYQARPAADGVYPGMLVCHENRGLNDHIRDVARRLAKAGYAALAIDLLSREGGAAAVSADQIPALLSAAPEQRHVDDFAAGLAYMQTSDFVDATRIGMTGYCFGGGITWRSAVALPELRVVVPFYGPAPDLAQVPNIRAAVFGVYAEQDSRINAGKDALEDALLNAGITFELKIYAGVNHAFHNDTGQRYIEEQATRAWLDTLDWLEQYL